MLRKLLFTISIILCCTTLMADPTLFIGADYAISNNKLVMSASPVKAVNLSDVKFGWDLDDTLIHPDKMTGARNFLSLDTPVFLWEIAYAYLSDNNLPSIMQGGAEQIARRFPNLSEYILNLANSVTPIPGSLHIVQELHALGYSQLLATNKERILLNEALLRNNTTPPLFAIITSGLGRDQEFTAATTASPEAIITNFTFTPHKKPQLGYYQAFEDVFNPAHGPVIFVDDKKLNVQIAIEAHPHWIGIVFTNPEQLRADLVALGILPATTELQTALALDENPQN